MAELFSLRCLPFDDSSDLGPFGECLRRGRAAKCVLSAARNQNSIIALADSLTVPQRCPDLELTSSNSLDATELFLPLRFDSSGEVSALGLPLLRPGCRGA